MTDAKPARPSLTVLVDGTPLPDAEARAFWERFSAHMEAHRGDLRGFAEAEGFASVHPEMGPSGATLVASRTAPQQPYRNVSKEGGSGGSKPQGGGPKPQGGGSKPQGGGPKPQGGGPKPQGGGPKPQGGGPSGRRDPAAARHGGGGKPAGGSGRPPGGGKAGGPRGPASGPGPGKPSGPRGGGSQGPGRRQG